MSRPLREIIQGATYHCFTRCHGKKNLFLSSHTRRHFTELILMCQKKYNFDLVAVETVGNHIHLIIRTVENGETISRIMQYIKARVAEKYNRAISGTGSFWNERFGCSIIDNADDPQQYLLWLLWYIGYNSVRKGLSRNPRDNEIGFINCYLTEGYKTCVKITQHSYFSCLGSSFQECAKKFLWYEDAYLKRISIFQ